MMQKKLVNLFVLLFCVNQSVYALPRGFVYLSDVDPTILQEMRYAGYHNFIGKPLNGYDSGVCILTQEAAFALRRIQQSLSRYSLSLKVYDCYRPVSAVMEFVAWSRDAGSQAMKLEFYPHVNKADVFKLGYVAMRSGHSRGSTVDLTIVTLPPQKQPQYHSGDYLVSCEAPVGKRFHDNSIDMGTGFDCLDATAHVFNKHVSVTALNHRMRLRNIMTENGFEPYDKEWWHFTFQPEPFPGTYFGFAVR